MNQRPDITSSDCGTARPGYHRSSDDCFRHVVTTDDFRLLARSRLPKVVFDYLEGGAEEELTLRANRLAFQNTIFRPRYGSVPDYSELAVRVLGTEISLPLLLAPVGYSSIFHPGGELAVARAASKAKTIYIMSTFSSQRLERVKVEAGGHVWYQLYLVGGRQAAEDAIGRAQIAGISGLVLTIDSPIAGLRERDIRNGVRELILGSILSKIPFFGQLLIKPRWLAGFLFAGGLPKLENVITRDRRALRITEATQVALSWKDVRWIRELWKGPLIIKGILTADDARQAVDDGANAVVVSNHGGRQLDSLPASLQALPEVVTAVNDQIEVFLDGGIRRGSDIVKALCLGARAVLCGRAFAYGLAAGGEIGVERVLTIFRKDLERTLKLLGCRSVNNLDRSYIM